MDSLKLNQQLLTYTGQDLLDLAEMIAEKLRPKDTDIGIGIEALMDACNISESTAKRLKKEGVFNAAIISQSRYSCIVDKPKAFELYKLYKHGIKTH